MHRTATALVVQVSHLPQDDDQQPADDTGLWAAILLLVSALTIAAHAAHLRRGAASAEGER